MYLVSPKWTDRYSKAEISSFVLHLTTSPIYDFPRKEHWDSETILCLLRPKNTLKGHLSPGTLYSIDPSTQKGLPVIMVE